jgi:hypothetical protein
MGEEVGSTKDLATKIFSRCFDCKGCTKAFIILLESPSISPIVMTSVLGGIVKED